MDAVSQIHSDLESLRQRRVLALTTYIALIGVFFGFIFIQPAPMAMPRDVPWTIAFSLLFLGSILGASVTIGYPLVSRRVMYIVSGVMSVGMIIALFMVMDSNGPSPKDPVAAGMKCFTVGTSVSAVAMVVLGVVSGRVWRRFPDPGFVLSLGMTGIGLGFLHMRCGGTDPFHMLSHFAPLVVLYTIAHFVMRARTRFLADS